MIALHPRAATAAYDCGGCDACFCGTVGVAGDLCPKLGMQTYADVCGRMLTYADVCCFCGPVGGAGDVFLKLGSDDDLIIMHRIHAANLALNALYTF